jgi:hypothetical protein
VLLAWVRSARRSTADAASADQGQGVQAEPVVRASARSRLERLVIVAEAVEQHRTGATSHAQRQALTPVDRFSVGSVEQRNRSGFVATIGGEDRRRVDQLRGSGHLADRSGFIHQSRGCGELAGV